MNKENKEKLQEKDFVEGEEGIKRRRKRRRKTIGEEGSRKQTGVGLLITLVLGLMFYLPREVRDWWKDWNNPETITILKPVGDAKDVSEVIGFKVTIKEKQDVEEAVEELLKDLSGDYGVWVENLVTEEGFVINANKTISLSDKTQPSILTVLFFLKSFCFNVFMFWCFNVHTRRLRRFHLSYKRPALACHHTFRQELP